MANDRKRGLGKGIGSLMSGFDFDTQTEDILTKTINEEARQNKMAIVQLDISRIRTNPSQPRKYFDEDSLGELAQSIKAQGIIQPLTVEEIAPGSSPLSPGREDTVLQRWQGWRRFLQSL